MQKIKASDIPCPTESQEQQTLFGFCSVELSRYPAVRSPRNSINFFDIATLFKFPHLQITVSGLYLYVITICDSCQPLFVILYFHIL